MRPGGMDGAIGLKEYAVAKYLLATNGIFGLLMTGYAMNKAATDCRQICRKSCSIADIAHDHALIEGTLDNPQKLKSASV